MYSVDILKDIIYIFKCLCKSSHSKDALRFFAHNGFYVLSHLVEEFVNVHGSQFSLVKKLIDLVESMSSGKEKYRGACALFWKFTPWHKLMY